MTKHSKNATDGAVFTYAERRGMEHGSVRARVGSGSLRAWDSCSLLLSPALAPCVTPSGVLYDRGAILRALIEQRTALRTSNASSTRKSFSVTNEDDADDAVHRPAPEKIPATRARAKESSFWLPGATAVHDAEGKELAVSGGVRKRRRCPVTNRPLKAKELVDLKPLEAGGASKGDARFMCPVCRCALTNAAKPVALRTGTVLCGKCTDSFVRTEGTDPVTSNEVDVEKDIIVIRHGGTSFAASGGEAKVATLYHPSAR